MLNERDRVYLGFDVEALPTEHGPLYVLNTGLGYRIAATAEVVALAQLLAQRGGELAMLEYELAEARRQLAARRGGKGTA
jgi:hypothetical protein